MKIWATKNRDSYGVQLWSEEPIYVVKKDTWMSAAGNHVNLGFIYNDCDVFKNLTFENSPMEVELKLVEK